MATDTKCFVAGIIWTKAIFSSWVLLALVPPEIGGRKLSKFFLMDYSEAVCNDGSPASFYYSPSPSGADQWVVYLEGGSFCENNQTCASRPEYYTTTNSPAYPKTMVGTDLFESGSSSPFGEFHAVYVPYCTSDMHIGNRKAPLALHNKKSIYIRGKLVIEGVFKELEKRGLNDNSKLVLAGTSAGALGALIHGIRFRQAGKYKHLAVVVDSAWFIDHGGILSEIYSATQYKENLPNLCRPPAGREGSLSCCLMAGCLINEFASGLNIPTFVISSRTDVFIFATIANRSDKHPQFNFADPKNSFPLQIDLYAGAMNSSLARSSQVTVSLFQPGCGQHGYLRNNPHLSSRVEDSGRLSVPTMNDVTLEYAYQRMPGYWQDVTVNGISLSSSLAQWVRSNYSQQLVWERCRGFLCNSTCPDKIHTRLVQESYPEWIQWLILVLAIASLAVPILFKAFLSIVSHHVRRSAVLDQFEYSNGDISWSRTGSKRLSARFKSQRRLMAPILSRAKSLINVLKGEDLQLACRSLTVTVSTKFNLDKNPNEKTATESATCTKTILEDIEVQLHTNQLVGVMGPSGSGKTTFLHVLANRREGYTIEVR